MKYYTDVSLYFLGLTTALVTTLRMSDTLPELRCVLARAAITNSIVVGLAGAYAVFMGDFTECSPRKLLASNAHKHALPSFIATLMLLHWKTFVGVERVHAKDVLVVFVGLLVMYLWTPLRTGELCAEKVRRAYGVSFPCAWIGGMCLLNLIVLHAQYNGARVPIPSHKTCFY